jgi:chondroitin 4-sulfotransferase 11
MTYSFNLPYHHRLNYQKNFNILSLKYKTIYFNTPKNANSSMKAQFVEMLDLPKTEKFPKDIHYNYNFPIALQDEMNSTYQDFLKFSILRNPWERLASCYNNKIKQDAGTGQNYILECHPDLYIGMSFEKFVEVVAEIPDSEADFHFCSQIYLMLYPDGTFPMNYLCNIENLDFHIKEIQSKTGIPFPSFLQLNSSNKSSYKSIYTPELIEKVGKRYQADIDFFKYKFGEKNELFSFGNVSREWMKYISEDPLMFLVLKEKNRELLQISLLKKLPQTKEIKQLKKEIKQLKEGVKSLEEEVKNLENSISWKMTAPLRSLMSIFLKSKTD